ncbi:unnamed protein product, partial [Amoebophrya sp. A25]|eukprot:GSA25T00000895001.1
MKLVKTKSVDEKKSGKRFAPAEGVDSKTKSSTSTTSTRTKPEIATSSPARKENKNKDESTPVSTTKLSTTQLYISLENLT